MVESQITLQKDLVSIGSGTSVDSGDHNRGLLDEVFSAAISKSASAIMGRDWAAKHQYSCGVTAKGMSDLATNIPLFMGGTRGYVLTAALYGVKQAKFGEKGTDALMDASLGVLKGLSTKAVMDTVGNAQDWGFAAKGVAMEALSRTLDVGLTRQTYLDSKGNLSLEAGGKEVLASALDKKALLTDALVFGTSHFAFKGIDSALSGRLSRSPLLATQFTGMTMGIGEGTVNELTREKQDHESFSWSKVLTSAAIESVITAGAAGAGYRLTEASNLPHVVRTSRDQFTSGNASAAKFKSAARSMRSLFKPSESD